MLADVQAPLTKQATDILNTWHAAFCWRLRWPTYAKAWDSQRNTIAGTWAAKA